MFRSRLLVSMCLALLFAAANCPAAPPRPSTAGPGVHVLAPALAMPGLGRERTLRVYLPPGYATSGKRYPVLYMHDAQNLFDDATSFIGEWGVDESLDALARDGIELIVVGIDHGQETRNVELSPWSHPEIGTSVGDAYLAFLVDTVKPFIDRRYRTRGGREDTGVMGSSLGALMSQQAIQRHPDVFGKVGLFSPSYWISERAYQDASAHPLPRDARVYLVAGGKEGQKHVANLWRMERLLRPQAPRLRALVRAGAGHNESFWKAEFPDAVRFLFGQ